MKTNKCQENVTPFCDGLKEQAFIVYTPVFIPRLCNFTIYEIDILY